MLEKERKFILKELPKEGAVDCIKHIKQAYLFLDGPNHLRVRIQNDEAFLTYKSIVSDFIKKEYEYQIPMSDALELYEMTKIRVEKVRYSTTFKGNVVDMDVYKDGRMVVEIEYEDELDELPDYCGEEVTGKREWSNIQMALDNAKQ